MLLLRCHHAGTLLPLAPACLPARLPPRLPARDIPLPSPQACHFVLLVPPLVGLYLEKAEASSPHSRCMCLLLTLPACACSGGAAWRREFWPPVCAEQVASLVGGLVRRGGWVYQRGHKAEYMRVSKGRPCRRRLSGLASRLEQQLL